MSFDYGQWAQAQQARVEEALDGYTQISTPSAGALATLHEAMRHAVLGGGKRLRPLLIIATAQAIGAQSEQPVLRAACAVELIHAYSLVHDDLPCMDNDVLRRGQPTVHVKYGQAMALLAGDALQTLAFEALTPAQTDANTDIPPAMQARLVAILAHAAGAKGMAAGQAIDLANVGHTLDETHLREMHLLKTGALLCACIEMGIACHAHGIDEKAQTALRTYARAMGLAFQVVDDILDATAQSTVIGKTAGKDAQAGKPTYVSLMGLEVAKQQAHTLHVQASQALAESGLQQACALQALADTIVGRSY